MGAEAKGRPGGDTHTDTQTHSMTHTPAMEMPRPQS